MPPLPVLLGHKAQKRVAARSAATLFYGSYTFATKKTDRGNSPKNKWYPLE
ncbi:hypothetical protein [Pseudanabaena sp. UWO310]|uniref:hypothetical protein n=1 Tax=Pseudanabaena sp. UWO310 TaxID=2480795 RepID=UPI0016811DDF|nr:hypothetical protein [Pseudanabaena sp. UWO310]